MKKIFLIVIAFQMHFLSAIDGTHSQEFLEEQKNLIQAGFDPEVVKPIEQFSAEFSQLVMDTSATRELKGKISYMNKLTVSEDEKPQWITLHGPSGNGKTVLAQMTMQQLGIPAIFVRASMLGKGGVQNAVMTELSNIMKYIKQKNKPYGIVLDEADIILRVSPNNPSGVPKQVCQVIDGIEHYPHIKVINTANKISGLEDFVCGRISSNCVEVGPGISVESKKRIFSYYMRNVATVLSKVRLNKEVERNSTFAPRDLKFLAGKLQELANERELGGIVNEEDLKKGIKLTKDNIEEIKRQETLLEWAWRGVKENPGITLGAVLSGVGAGIGYVAKNGQTLLEKLKWVKSMTPLG